MNTHWTAQGYLHVKTAVGQYAIATEGKDPAQAAVDAIRAANERIVRLQRRISALSSFVNCETEADPDALRV